MLQRPSLEKVATTTLTIATVAIAALLVEQRWTSTRGSTPQRGSAPESRIEFVKNWRTRLADVSVALGDTSRPVQIAVFTDFQCVFCSRMDSILADIETGTEVKSEDLSFIFHCRVTTSLHRPQSLSSVLPHRGGQPRCIISCTSASATSGCDRG
jgi:hypothetical protein